MKFIIDTEKMFEVGGNIYFLAAVKGAKTGDVDGAVFVLHDIEYAQKRFLRMDWAKKILKEPKKPFWTRMFHLDYDGVI